jgi:hypothetical protein
VKDEQDSVLQGVRISATSSDAPGDHVVVADDAGYYRLLELPPATYTLTAELAGFSKWVRQDLVMRAGLNINVTIILKVGDVNESLEVRADPPLLERFSATQGINISGEFQRAVPLAARKNWSDFLLLTPGVVNRFGPTADLIYVNGGNLDSHVIQVDGADISPPASNGVVFTFMGSDALEDVQIRTSNAPASAPLGQAAIISIAARSGTNTFRSDVSVLGERKSWSSNNNPGGTTAAFGLAQTDLSAGGPIRRDRAWVFGSYRYSHLDRGVSRTATQIDILRAISPGFTPFDAQTTNYQAFVKLTGSLSSKHQLSAFYQYGHDTDGSGGSVDAASFSAAIFGGHSASARLSSLWFSTFSTRVNVAYNTQAGYTQLERYDIPGRQVYSNTLLSGGRLVGSNLIADLDNLIGTSAETPNKQLTISGDATYQVSRWRGLHALEFGTYLQPLRTSVFTNRYAAGGFAFEDWVLRDPTNPSRGAVPFHQRIYDGDRFTARDAKATDYAVYAQDLFQATSRLTLTPGIRIDRLRYVDRIFDTTYQRSTAIGPRLGATYALTEAGRDVLRFHVGRVHDAVAGTGAFSSMVGSASPGVRDLYDLDGDGHMETVFVTPQLTQQAANRRIDLDGYRQPHVDELLFGYQRQFAGKFVSDISVLRRTFKDNRALVEVNGIYQNGVFQGYRDESQNDVFQATSNIWNWPVYSSLQLQIARNASPLQIVGSYVRQWRHLEGTWQPNDPASFIQPEAFANDRGIGPSSTELSTNSLSGTQGVSGSAGWRDHVARLAVAYQGPKGLRIASSYVLESGRWSGPIVTRIAAPDPRFGPPTVRLSNGRIVSNPLATLIRFAYATRGDGQFATPWLSTLNVQVSRPFQFRRLTVQPAIETLNLLNGDGDQDLVFGSAANQINTPNFGTAGNRQPPRVVQASVRVAFRD